MASLKCSKCGFGIHYHGEPDNTEYIMIKETDWFNITKNIFDPKNKIMKDGYPMLFRSDTIEDEFSDCFIKFWICKRCGTLAIFDGIYVDSVYAPTEDKVPVDKHSKMYIVFSDYLWDEITEHSIPVSEIPSKFAPSYVAIRNSEYIWLLNSGSDRECIKIYHRIPVAKE